MLESRPREHISYEFAIWWGSSYVTTAPDFCQKPFRDMVENNKQLFEYVTISGYSFIYHNWAERTRGGAYIKENSIFNERIDLHELNTDIENMWVGSKGKEDKPVLIRTFYQPSSNNQDKLEWIDKTETILEIIPHYFLTV